MARNEDDYIHVTVATVIERDGRFLLVEEQAPEGLVINQPAGHVELGETLAQAAVRETLEETGCNVALDGILGLAQHRAPANGVTYLRTTFFGHIVSENPQATLDTGIVRTLWMSYEDMQIDSDRMRSPLVINSVAQYLAGHRWPLETIYYSAT